MRQASNPRTRPCAPVNEAQARTFREVRAFFDAAPAVKESASIARTPYMRGHDPVVQTPSQLIETYQYGIDTAPVGEHDDRSQPIWKRMLQGATDRGLRGLT